MRGEMKRSQVPGSRLLVLGSEFQAGYSAKRTDRHLPSRSPISSHRSPPRGFTLVELLTVISILSLLAALLMPGLKAARETGRAMICLNNIRQLVLADSLYADDNDGKLVPYRNTIYRYYPELLTRYVGATSVTDPRFSKLVQCPSLRSDEAYYQSYGYPFTIGQNDYLAGWEDIVSLPPVSIGNLRQPSRTALFGDTTGTSSIRFYYESTIAGYPPNTPWRHSNGMNVGYADGGARYVPYGDRPHYLNDTAGWYVFWIGTPDGTRP